METLGFGASGFEAALGVEPSALEPEPRSGEGLAWPFCLRAGVDSAGVGPLAGSGAESAGVG
eukprot:6491008-Heterocapsa_arctica.AAC.1